MLNVSLGKDMWKCTNALCL